MSLNPLEIALAFNSPIFDEVNSDSRRSQIVRAVGSQKVIYGGAEAVNRNEESGRNEEAASNETAGEEEEHTHLHSVSEGETFLDQRSPRLRLKFNYVHDSIEHGGDDVPTTTPPKSGDMFC